MHDLDVIVADMLPLQSKNLTRAHAREQGQANDQLLAHRKNRGAEEPRLYLPCRYVLSIHTSKLRTPIAEIRDKDDQLYAVGRCRNGVIPNTNRCMNTNSPRTGSRSARRSSGLLPRSQSL